MIFVVTIIVSLLCNCADSTGTILSTSICLPSSKEAHTSRSHIAVNLLSCLSTLATHPPLTLEALAGSGVHKLDKEAFNCVVRFNGEWFSGQVQLTVTEVVIVIAQPCVQNIPYL